MRSAALAVVLLLAACKHDHPAAQTPADEHAQAGACDALGADACAARTDCAVITAQEEDASRSCVLEPVGVGCHAADTACDDAITYAIDADQAGWWFMDTCVPAGFEVTATVQTESAPPPPCE